MDDTDLFPGEREYAWTIERDGRPWYSMPYIVWDPDRSVVAARATLWGAKRALRREQRRRRKGVKERVVVYSEPNNQWLKAR